MEEQKVLNLCHIMDYRNGTQISKCLGKAEREDLKELKPYKELLKDEVIKVLQAILPFLSTKGEDSKRSIAILKLDELGVQVEDCEAPIIESDEEKDLKEEGKKKVKKIGGTGTGSVKAEKKINELEKKVKMLEEKVLECESGYRAIQRMLEIDQELNGSPKATKDK